MNRGAAAISLALLAACGARSGLRVPEDYVAVLDASTPRDAPSDRGHAPPDARDAAHDAGTLCEVPLRPPSVAPNVVFVLDRSGSMRGRFPRESPRYPGASKWAIMTEFLVGSVGLLRSRGERARFALVTYTTERARCPVLRVVPAALRNGDAIEEELRAYGPSGGTPTGEALAGVLAELRTIAPDVAPTVLVLATDGEPNSCSGAPDGREETLRAVDASYAAGVRTYVVSVGDDVAETHLREVANAGLGLPRTTTSTPVWIGTNPTILREAIDRIIATAVDCRLELARPIDPRRACEGTVLLGGEPLACDDPDGFRVEDDGRTVEILGAACDAIVRGEARLSGYFPCE